MTAVYEHLLSTFGVNLEAKQEMDLNEKWLSYSLNHNSNTSDIPIILIERGPKNITEVKNVMKNFNNCVILFLERNTLFLKIPGASITIVLDSSSEYERTASILQSCNLDNAKSDLQLQLGIKKAIEAIPSATGTFDNRGVFSTHYLRNRVFDDSKIDIDKILDNVKKKIGDTPKVILKTLGWDMSDGTYHDGKVSVMITNQDDFSIREKNSDIAPSYTAITKLKESQWVILTNGTRWRLYTNRISASSTNYFEILLDKNNDTITKYLIVMFSNMSYHENDADGTTSDIDRFFEQSKTYAKELEENLSIQIMSANGLFLDIVKGTLNHDMKKTFTGYDLTNAKQAALKIMYRVWFLAYAESRNLLPVDDARYKPISLRMIQNSLDAFEENPAGTECWSSLLKLFEGIRKGSKAHNLPQYNGGLFSFDQHVDGLHMENKFIARALRGLFERDGEAVDYTSLGVRHLGNIFESLMAFNVHQADKDIMLLEKKDKVMEVKTMQEATYSYKKNDLYLASKSGVSLRKTTASFYTPDKIVEFLVKQGVEPVFEKREKVIREDLKKYEKSKSDEDRLVCINGLLDIQVLDPSMGSGHFLVEALNRITSWVTDMLNIYPSHPLAREIEDDRQTILAEQKNNGITINENLLTHDVLLKRKIMKRCIFGVDINPMAVELAKLSLWLDSFAIGVPLTYMDHHIKAGDSTIGMFLDDLKNKDMRTLDDWTPGAKSNKMIHDVILSSDVTVAQAHASQDRYLEHMKSTTPTRRVLDALTASKIDPNIFPKKGGNEFIHRFGRYLKDESKEFGNARSSVNLLSETYRFFHWELEFMDAFTDSRRGFDVILGNPPWDRNKHSNTEFFTPLYPAFRSLKPNTKKIARRNKLLEDSNIRAEYNTYKKQFEEKNKFYETYEMQGMGDRELSNLILERSLGLVAENGIISMVMPSQILSGVGSAYIRQHLLEKDIMSLYVFENRKKIFEIDSRYRFVLLSVRNEKGGDKFPGGFYLHYMESLQNQDKEAEKFGTISKRLIQKMSPDTYVIPEAVGDHLKILEKISKGYDLESGLGDGWNVSLSNGFSGGNDTHLFLEDGNGWPVHEGKTIHQYNHVWSKPKFTVDEKKGLERMGKIKILAKNHREFYNSFRLIFRHVARSTDIRTIISTVIPPHTFYTDSLRSIILAHDDKIMLDSEYLKNIAYLCGVINSTTFDFVGRASTQTNISTIIKSLPLPNNDHKNIISELAASLMVGSPEFEGFADIIGIENRKLSPADRIAYAAELDALVAYSYGLTKKEYGVVIDSFNIFKPDPSLYDLNDVIWNSNNLKGFYGETTSVALEYYDNLPVIQEEKQ